MLISQIYADYQITTWRAETLRKEYSKLQDRAETPRSAGAFTDVRPTAPGSNDYILAKLADAREAWQLAALDALEARQKLFDLINRLEDGEASAVLCYYYLDGLRPAEIVKAWTRDKRGSITERTAWRKIAAGNNELEELLKRGTPKS